MEVKIISEFYEILEDKPIDTTKELLYQHYCKHECDDPKNINEFHKLCCICRELQNKCNSCYSYLTEKSCRNCSNKQICKYLGSIEQTIRPFIKISQTINHFPNEKHKKINEFLKLFANNCLSFNQNWSK